MSADLADRVPVNPDAAGRPHGPFSHAIEHQGLLYCSGVLGVDGDGSLVNGSVAAEARRCLENLQAVCRAAGTNLSRALRVTIYTTHIEEFAEINAAYAPFFEVDPPTRTTVGIARLVIGARVEMDAVVAM